MANLFSGVKDPLIQGTGTLTDYQTTADERFAAEWEGALDQNPLAQGARMARYAIENNARFFGLESNMVTPEAAREELKSRGLEGHLTIPEGGISRVELDSIQYLKQRELSRQAKGAMNQSMFSHLAGFAGGLAGSAIDPINIASAFVPIVPEARLATMLGKAGSSALGRAAVRAQVGATEGAVGALMIEPFTYAMAQYEQMDYTPVDSFMNVVFGGLLGGGLHMAGGAVYDWRATRAMNSLQRGLDAMNMRDMAPDLQDEVQLDILRRFTEAEETGAPLPDADEIIAQRMTPDQEAAVREADDMPGEVPRATRADGQPSQPRGLDELIPEAKSDRTAETFNRQFLDKEQGDVSGFADVRPPREDIFEVAEANFAGRTAHAAKTVPIDQLTGGVSTDPAEIKRVNNLVELMSGPNGYLERLIIDSDGNVIEGQHRLEALRKMGIKQVPVIEIRELRAGLPVDQMMDAMQAVRGLHRDQARQIVDNIAEAIADVGSVAEVRAQYAPPRGFERAWEAALDAAEAGDMKAQSEPALDRFGRLTEAFWRWFGKSKAVDEDGNPLVYYHSTTGDFDTFDISKSSPGAAYGPGIYLTLDSNDTSWARGVGHNVMALFVKMENPLDTTKPLTEHEAAALRAVGMDWVKAGIPTPLTSMERRFGSVGAAAKAAGFDALVHRGPQGQPHLLVFNEKQVKSATGNRGTYDPELADITAQSDIVEDAAGPGSGLTPYNDTLGGKTDVNQPQSPDVIGAEERGLRLLTGVRRSPGILPPSPAWSDTAPLAYLPTTVKIPGVGTVEAQAFPLARKAARDYVESQGRAYDPITTYRKVDPARAGRIAEAFEQMRHEPDNPEVKAAYEAMVKETLAQWEAVKRTGLVVEFIDISKGDPYAASPRLAIEDVRNNNHLWVFSTDDGFGTDGITAKDESDNPLFQIVPGETISGKPVRANDIFRIVHDYFGHIKDGVGFRADGEENAWRSHSRMYSPQAARAMTTETRGQNSWLNYGPYGEKNRTALTQDTIFAEQKIGLLPDWVMWEGLDDLPLPVPAEPRTLADELGFGDLKMMGEPLDPADGPDAPKVIGTDAAGRPVLDFRNSVVSHFTDQESADNINEFGYRVVGDGYYGDAISFTPNREFGSQFGDVETTARVSPNARILQLGVDEDWKIFKAITDQRNVVMYARQPGQKSWRQAFLEKGIDGVYDAGAGDLFIYNERVVKPTAMEGIDDLKTMLGGERAAPDTPEFKRWFGDSKVVDDNGDPLIVYHGGAKGITSFNNPDGRYKTGIFFTGDNDIAKAFGYGGQTYEVYLKLENPFVFDAGGNYYSAIPRPIEMEKFATTEKVDTDLVAEWAFKNGYDGVILKNVLEGRGNKVGDIYIASKNTQVKSATHNIGTYDPDLADIRAQSDIKETGAVMDEDGGIHVWHGSPHDFDRFILSDKTIGTGEGAQAFGHGLYFAEARKLGEYYRDMLVERPNTDKLSLQKIWALENEELSDRLLKGIEMAVENSIIDERAAPKWADVVMDLRARYGKEPGFDLAIKTFEESGFKDEFDKPRGKLYKVKLRVKPTELLDWDLPLSEQPKRVQGAIKEVANSFESYDRFDNLALAAIRGEHPRDKSYVPTGQDVVMDIAAQGLDASTSAKLKAAGIKGIRYKDAWSRGKDGGTYNYVIFDEDLIDIIDKFQMDLDEQPDLVAAHNLTAANLLHADKMGGIAAPSLAIAKASDGHEGYGEITLIGSKDLVDPQKGANVFAGDIYSARYPTVHYNIKYENIRKLEKQFAATAKEMGVTLKDTLDDDALEREGPRALENSVGALLSYAKEKGVKVEAYVFDRDAWEIRNRDAQAKEQAIHREWRERSEAERERAQAEGRAPDDTALDEEFQPKYMAARREAASIMREPDRALDEIKYKLRDKFRNDSGFAEWADAKFAELKAKERIFKGFSNTTGAKMYTQHTLDNVVKLMTRKLRDGEGFNYGIGNLRAKVAPKFRSVEAIRARKGSLVKREEFDAIKKEADAELISIADQLLPKLKYKGNSFGQLDALTQHMAEAIDRNNVKRVFQEYYNNLTDDDVRMVGNFLQKLKTMPTTYFEAKLDRAVQIGEFEAAIVPNTLSKKAREVLERSGVKQIIEYDPSVDGARQAAIDSVRDMKFMMDNDLRNAGFYSALERALTDAPIKKATGKEWRGWLSNRPGIKADEIEYTGLDDFLTLNQDTPLTRNEVLAHVQDNAIQIVENSFGDDPPLHIDGIEPDPEIAAEYASQLSEIEAEIADALKASGMKRDELKAVSPDGQIVEVRKSIMGNWHTIARNGDWSTTKYATKEEATAVMEAAAKIWDQIGKFQDKVAKETNRARDIRRTILERSLEKVRGSAPRPRDIGPPKWAQYTIADGVNYREIVFEWANPPDSLKQRPFAQSHHERDNVLAHARVVDRQLPDGSMAVHGEELQSDWHQKGRDFGYYKNLSKQDGKRLVEIEAALDKSERAVMDLYDTIAKENGYKSLADFEKQKYAEAKRAIDEDPRVKAIFENDNVLIKERDALIAKQVKQPRQVPDAPFKKNWVEVVLKRLILYAAHKGYSELLITPGIIQAERFDLTTHVDAVRIYPLQDDIWEVQGIKNGDVIIDSIEVHRDDLPEHIGKKAAKQILENPTRKFKDTSANSRSIGEAHELSGPDLRIGGHGMIEFYDGIVVNFLNSFGKKYGAKVGTRRLMVDYNAGGGNKLQQGWDLHSFPIPETLREQAKKGIPLFQSDVVDVNAKDQIKAGPYTYTKMDTERRQRSEALRDAVDGLISKYTGGRADTRWYSSISQKVGGKTHKVDGGFSALRGIIVMALDAADMVGSAKHEALHFLKDRGLISDAEWDNLVRTALRQGWLDKKYGGSKNTIRQRYAHLPLLDQIEEAIAEEFRAGRYDQFQGYPPAVRAVLVKLRKFFDAVAKEARKIFGMEATAEDIFRAIESGEIGRRADADKAKVEEAAILDAPQRSAPQQMKNQSTPEDDPLRVDRWAADDVAIAAEAYDDSKRKDETLQDIEADTAILGAHLESMRQRGLLSQEDEADLLASNDTARMMEEQAAAYEAAGICEGEE